MRFPNSGPISGEFLILLRTPQPPMCCFQLKALLPPNAIYLDQPFPEGFWSQPILKFNIWLFSGSLSLSPVENPLENLVWRSSKIKFIGCSNGFAFLAALVERTKMEKFCPRLGQTWEQHHCFHPAINCGFHKTE